MAGTPMLSLRKGPSPKPPALPAVQLLVFQIGGKLFGVEIERLGQIIDFRRPTRTPRRPAYVDGVIAHRGAILPLFSLRRRLGLAPMSPGAPGESRQAILVVRLPPDDRLVGVSVDAVFKVITLDPQGILTPPPKVFGIRSEFIRGVANIGGRPVVWLDQERLLSSSEEITLTT